MRLLFLSKVPFVVAVVVDIVVVVAIAAVVVHRYSRGFRRRRHRCSVRVQMKAQVLLWPTRDPLPTR